MTQTAVKGTSTAAGANAQVVADLWDRFADGLRGFITTRVSNPADVEDILQDVFVKVQRGASQLRDTDRLTTWIFRIAHNAIIDHYRSAPRRREIPVEEFERVEWRAAVDDAIDDQTIVRSEIAACMRPLIAQLPDNYRGALEMVELGGMSQTEAARQLGLSASGMKSRVQRARSQVLEGLNAWCSIAVDARGGPMECLPGPDGPCG